MTTFDEKLSGLNRKRKKIIFAYYELRTHKPKSKKFVLVREVAEKLEYVVDRNKSNSYVMKVIRDWEKS